ncbi:MAG: ribonuclease P protein component [Deltaproteobacteria bacterium]|nr:ribonuclease P protein component [Deltaproteobacteria bacterium]
MKSRRDFLRIQQKGRKFRSQHFILSLFPPHPDAQTSSPGRLGITVTTKVHKRAVKRNALKRRVRELYRHKCQSPPFPCDVVVIALMGAAELDFAAIREQLLTLFERSKLIRTESVSPRRNG